jgi:hypothetical protein
MESAMSVILRIILVPLTLYLGVTAIVSLVAGQWMALFGSCAVLVVSLGFAGWVEVLTADKASKIVISRGLNADFVSQYAGQGVVIDLANKRFLVGSLRGAPAMEFRSATEIISENDGSLGARATRYKIKVMTNDFNSPLLTAQFASEAKRDEAYSKLHSALNNA